MKRNLRILLAIPIISFSFIQQLPAQHTSGGNFHALALCADSTVRGWGSNGSGQLGNGYTSTQQNSPVQANLLTGIIAVAGGGSSHFLKYDGTVWACGGNGYGVLGDGTMTDKSTPVLISTLTDIVAVQSGIHHAIFLKADGTVWACGLNSSGQFGNGSVSSVPAPTPAKIDSLSGIIAIATEFDHSLFLKNDSTVWASGDNTYGQLGNGTNANSSIPVQVSSLTGIIAIAVGEEHSIFLKYDGSVWACGRNTYGQLGNGTNTHSNIPVQVTNLSGIVSIACGRAFSLFLKNNGTVWACGGNTYGQHGNGTTSHSNIPVQASSLSGIIEIAGGGFHSQFLKNDGTLWTCGRNDYGALGNGSSGSSPNPIPIQVSGLCQMIACTPVWGDTLTVSHCGSYTSASNTTYSTSGIYFDTLQTMMGCDSIITLNLTILAHSTGSETVSSCIEYVSPSGNHVWTSSGTYQDTLLNALGCDSVITVNLTINTVDVTVTQLTTTLAANASAATFQWLDCNNNFVAISGATSAIFTPSANGDYAVEVTQNACVDTSLCYGINGVGIEESAHGSGINIYPNPSGGEFGVVTSIERDMIVLEVIDITGRRILSGQFTKDELNNARFDLRGVEKGVYQVNLDFGDEVYTRLLIIR